MGDAALEHYGVDCVNKIIGETHILTFTSFFRGQLTPNFSLYSIRYPLLIEDNFLFNERYTGICHRKKHHQGLSIDVTYFQTYI